MYGKRKILIIFRVTLAYIRTSQPDICAQCLEVKYFFLRHFIGYDEYQLETHLGCDQRQAQAGISCGRFNQCPAGCYLAVGNSRFYHGFANAILDRPAGILIFKFQKKLAAARVEACHFQHRRVSNAI